MKLLKPILLIIFAWLVMSSTTAQAVMVYADSMGGSAAIHYLPATGASSIEDVLGPPVYSPTPENLPLGVRLSETAGDVPTTNSYLTVAMKNAAEGILGVSGTLQVFSDDDETAEGFIANERFDLWVSNNNGNNYTFVDTYYNDNADINILSYGIVTHVKLVGVGVDIFCQLDPGCTTPIFDNPMEVMAIGGIAATVPVPAAVWLFGSGLLGLVAAGRRRKK